MKLECPSCHQKYRLTGPSIPAAKTTVPCRVCTHPIPLRQQAAIPAAGVEGKALSVSCGYCGKAAVFDTAVAADAEKIPCPGCKHPIVLNPDRATAAVPKKPTGRNIHLRCGQCQQTYTLSRSKIPVNAASATCRACGNKIPIPRSLERHHRTDSLATATPPDLAAGATALEENPGLPASKKSVSRTTLALLIVALIGFGIWFGGSWLLDQVKTGWEVFVASRPGTVKRTPAGTFKSRPFAIVRLNPALVIHAVKGRIPENSIHQKSLSVAGALGFKRMELFLLPQSEWLAVPALIVEGRGVGHLKTLLAGYNLVEDGISRLGSGQYAIDLEALGEGNGKKYPPVSYVAWFQDDTLLLAPEVLMGNPPKVLEGLSKSQVSQFAGDFPAGRFAGAFAVELGKEFDDGWQARAGRNPALESDPRIVTAAGMGSSVISRLEDLLDAVSMLGAQLTVSGEERKRTFAYRQQFHSQPEAERFYAQLKAGDPRDPSLPWLARQMVTLFKDKRIEYVFALDRKQLDVGVRWLPDDDHLITNALMAAMTGSTTITPMMASTNIMEPTAGTVETVTTNPPSFALSIDREELARTVPAAFQASLFPAHYVEGAAPYVNLELDTVVFPNAALSEASYEILAVTSPAGEDILRRSEQDLKHTIQPGTLSPGFVAVNVQPNTPADALNAAVIQFELTVPTAVEQAEFRAGDPWGTVRQAGETALTLDHIEKDVAAVSFPKNQGIRLFAFDAEGRPLAVSESRIADTSAAVRFHGVIARLLVLVTAATASIPFELSVDLNQGQELQLAHQPETPARIRYDHRPVERFADYREADLADLRVRWDEGSEMSWFDSLMVVLPHGPFHGKAEWQAHFFGQRQPLYLSGNPANSGQQIRFDLEKGALQKAHAAYGRVVLQLSTDIHSQQLVKAADNVPVVLEMPSGKILKVIFNQNEVMITPFDESIVQLTAFDSQGRRLRRDAFSHSKGSLRKFYFWGIPARMEVDMAGGQVRRAIDFDIVQREVDRQSYEAFKAQVTEQREVVAALK